jgi:hypothetical protein
VISHSIYFLGGGFVPTWRQVEAIIQINILFTSGSRFDSSQG